MGKLKDLTGNVYGNWTVIEFAGIKNTVSMWKVSCMCGTVKVVQYSSLVGGGSKSCGCSKREYRLQKIPIDVLSPARTVMNVYKKQSQKRNLIFGLTFDEFYAISQQNCYYCNRIPSNVCNPNHCDNIFVYNGIDRLNNAQGYTVDNVVSCCKVCNYAKHTMTEQEFYAWIGNVYSHLIKTGRLSCLP